MKRIGIIFLVVLTGLLLTGCGSSKEDERAVLKDLRKLGLTDCNVVSGVGLSFGTITCMVNVHGEVCMQTIRWDTDRTFSVENQRTYDCTGKK